MGNTDILQKMRQDFQGKDEGNNGDVSGTTRTRACRRR